MNIEENRLKTFRNWPSNSAVAPAKLAKAGFYYTERDETVKCFSCEVEVSDWGFADQAMAKHRYYSPQCPFVLNSPTSGNVPYIPERPAEEDAGADDLREETARLRTFSHWPKADIVRPEALAKSGFFSLNVKDYTKCAFCDVVLISWEQGDDPNTEHLRCSPNCSYLARIMRNGETKLTESDLLSIGDKNLQELGVQQHKLPSHPEFATYEARIRTYAQWPSRVSQKPEELACAGFYYEGVGDRVRCFHCDGGLNHWDPDDEPWSQHAHWFPNCCFILLTKGPEFIKQSPPVNNDPGLIPQGAPSMRRTLTTDQELQAYLDSDQARSALSIGLQVDRVKRAIKNKLEETGVGFSSSDALIEAALNLQINDEELENPDTSDPNLARTVSSLLADVIHSAVTTEQGGRRDRAAGRAATDAMRGSKLSLEEENRQLKEARLCKICMDAEVGIVLLPCGHLTSCVHCAPNLKDCPLCRSPIKATVRTFLS